jgi:hypothetical protein
MWREVLGVEVELRQVERKIFFNAQSRLDYDVSASSWMGDYNDPNTFLDLFTSNGGNNKGFLNNQGGWSEVDSDYNIWSHPYNTYTGNAWGGTNSLTWAQSQGARFIRSRPALRPRRSDKMHAQGETEPAQRDTQPTSG